MLNEPHKPQVFRNREQPIRQFLIGFDQNEHHNALKDEIWCPLDARLAASRVGACKKQIIVMCETSENALITAEYHFFSTGSNFNIIDSFDIK